MTTAIHHKEPTTPSTLTMINKWSKVLKNKMKGNNSMYTLGSGWLFIELGSFVSNSLGLSQHIIYFLVVFTGLVLLAAFSKHLPGLVEFAIRPLMFRKDQLKPTFSYDEQGREIYFNNKKNYWFRHMYNEKGEILATYDSNNEWTIYVYDEFGKKSKLIDSTGLFRKYAYQDGTIAQVSESRIEEFSSK